MNKILFVEDDLDLRSILQLFLKKAPYESFFLENGLLAYELITKSDKLFDIVFMDMQMPVMNGITAVKKIREWEKENNKKRVFIVAMTANNGAEEIEKCIEAGYDHYFHKPILKKDLLNYIENKLNSTKEKSIETEI